MAVPTYWLVWTSAAAILGIAAGAIIVREPDFHAIVERDGTVVLCLSKGQMLFADRCAGSGRLTIVQPMEEGRIAWRTASGRVELENESPQNPACALSRAKWEQKSERSVQANRQIRKVDRSAISTQYFPVRVNLAAGELTAFALDLNNDGREELVFSFNNVRTVAAEYEKNKTAAPYLVVGAIANTDLRQQYPDIFYHDQGTYQGGTDTIGHMQIKGFFPFDPDRGELALLVSSQGYLQDIIRFDGKVQKIQTIQRGCD